MPTTNREDHASPPLRAVNLRVREDVRDLIDQAARTFGKSRTEFMIEASRQAAEQALLDQTFIRVDRKTFDLFTAVLDQPPASEGYARLMSAPRPWET